MNNLIPTKRAVIYCRVSTKEQVEEGNSLSTQEKNCREYALKYGYEIAEAFIEQGESAKTADRIEFQKLLTYCTNRKNKIDAVIAYKIDRISRNTDDYSQIRIILKRYGVEIKSTSEYFENTPAGRFMENIIANVAQFDNDVRTERSVGGMKDAMREGRYVWIAPFGYTNIRVSGKSTITPNEYAPILRKAFEMVATNTFSVEEVRNRMAIEGLRFKEKPLAKSHFYRILKNKVYAGWIIKFGECHRGLFEPIVTQELFEQVQRVLTYGKRRNLHYLKENPDFPLRRFIYHPSGIKLTGCWSQGRSKKYPYYLFHKLNKLYKKDFLEKEFKAYIDSYKLHETHYEKLKGFVNELLFKELKNVREERIKLKKQITLLKEDQSKLVRKNIQGVIPDTVLQNQLSLIEQELMEKNASLLKLPETPKEDTSLDALIDFLKNPGNTWETASFEVKLKLQWFYFPKGIHITETQSQTTKSGSIFKAEKIFLSNLISKVHLLSRTSHQEKEDNILTKLERNGLNEVPINSKKIFMEQLSKDIEYLADLKKEMEAHVNNETRTAT